MRSPRRESVSRRFVYTAVSAGGQVDEGTIEAVDREQAHHRLTRKGFRVFRLEPEGEARILDGHERETLSRDGLVLFYRQLHGMYRAGIQLQPAVAVLAHSTDHPAERKIFQAITEALKRGYSLGRCMGAFPAVFPPTHVRLVEAGQVGGIMEPVLESLARLSEQADQLQRKVWTALTYPLFVMVISVMAAMGVFQFILPPFIALVRQLDITLPLVTRTVVGVADVIRHPWFLLSVTALLAVLAFRWSTVVRLLDLRNRYERMAIRLPWIGPVVRKVALARALQILAALTRNGITLVEALRLSGAACGNCVVGHLYEEMALRLKGGEMLSEVVTSREGVLPRSLVAFILVGDTTGDLPGMFLRCADLLSLEAHHALEVMTEMLEPLIIGVLGFFCGVLMLSVFLPLYASLQAL